MLWNWPSWLDKEAALSATVTCWQTWLTPSDASSSVSGPPCLLQVLKDDEGYLQTPQELKGPMGPIPQAFAGINPTTAEI